MLMKKNKESADLDSRLQHHYFDTTHNDHSAQTNITNIHLVVFTFNFDTDFLILYSPEEERTIKRIFDYL